MKKTIRGFRTLFILIILAAMLIFGSMVAIFALVRDTPQDIFLWKYALTYEKKGDGGNKVWFVEKADKNGINSGEGALFYRKLDGLYAAVQYIPNPDGTCVYIDSDTHTKVETDENEIIGKILCSWDIEARK